MSKVFVQFILFIVSFVCVFIQMRFLILCLIYCLAFFVVV